MKLDEEDDEIYKDFYFASSKTIEEEVLSALNKLDEAEVKQVRTCIFVANLL